MKALVSSDRAPWTRRGYFVWEAAFGGPLLLVGGGSGVGSVGSRAESQAEGVGAPLITYARAREESRPHAPRVIG